MDVFLATAGTFLGLILGRTRCLLHNCFTEDAQCSLAYNDPKVALTPNKQAQADDEDSDASSTETVITIPPPGWPVIPPDRTPPTGAATPSNQSAR